MTKIRSNHPYQKVSQHKFHKDQNYVVYALVFIIMLVMIAACSQENENNEKEAETEREEPQESIGESSDLQEFDRSIYDEEQVLATYSLGELSGKQFMDYIAFRTLISGNVAPEQEYHDQILDAAILDLVIRDKMSDADLSWSESRAEQSWEQFVSIYGEEELLEAYSQLELNEEIVRHYLLNVLITEQYFLESIPDEERMVASVRHILIGAEGAIPGVERTLEEAEQQALDLYEQLQDGADFAQLAEEYSDDEGSRANGGLYANAQVTAWVPEFKQAAIEQEMGEIGLPVQTTFGYHIVLVEDRRVMDAQELNPNESNELIFREYMNFLNDELPSYIQKKHLE